MKLLVAFVLGLLAGPLATDAQPAMKVPRIGVLDYASASAAQHAWQAFRQRLRELGYVEGENIAFESRYADGKIDRLPDLAAELIRLKVDVIATGSVPAALAAKTATKTIPIVFTGVGEAVRTGLVASLARPGANITGVSMQVLDLSGKRFELLRKLVPAVSRFAILWDQPNLNSSLIATETEVAARALGVALQAVGVRDPSEFSTAFSAMRRKRAGALIVASSAIFLAERRRLAELAMENKLPTVFPQRDYVEAGGLMAYGANLADEARRAAVHVAKILKGAKPADLAVDQATTFELVINLKTAKALGLTIPQSVLMSATEVIE